MAGLLALGLGGCAAAGQTQVREPQSQPAQTAVKLTIAPQVTARSTPEPNLEKQARLTPKAPPQPPRVYPEPSVLDGLSAEKVEALLGQPGFKRRDEPAEIWQYRVGACTLDLFMYQAPDGQPWRVQHFETRAKEGQSITPKDCLTDVIKATEAASPA